ncbi:MAG: hypothetical protein U9O85_02525 [Euryarchaeota archaeon]|nr:hypothetical protein [Euryarchaeota archaeon]
MIREVTNWKIGEWIDFHIFRPHEKKGYIIHISGRPDFRMTISEKEQKVNQSKKVPVCIAMIGNRKIKNIGYIRTG